MDFKLPDKVYEVLKWLTMIVLPTLAWGYAQLGETWGWPYLDKIPKTISIITAIIGAIIGISTINYRKENPLQ